MTNQLFTVFLVFVGVISMYMAGVAMGWIDEPQLAETSKEENKNMALAISACVVTLGLVVGYFGGS